MARYDLYANPSGEGYLLDVQADPLEEFGTRVVIPLLAAEVTPPKTRRLHPIFAVGGANYVLATQLISAVPASELGEIRNNLSFYRDEIVAAMDMLFQGF